MNAQKGFDPVEATIETVQNAILSRRSTCHDVVMFYLTRIHAINPTINAIISLNPKALDDAIALDNALASGIKPGPLFGVPILLKDNFNTTNMKTTGGCLALKDLQPTADAKAVTALKEAGAIVLGKTNLHEMALEGLSVSSLGGQTRSPYDLTRTPGGSSGGSGAAVAASLCVFATGTDTVNSLRSPASANRLDRCAFRCIICIDLKVACSLVDRLVGSSAETVSCLYPSHKYVVHCVSCA
jgi:Asp-tRNA(Asn)/Glu-tRNA(Gln) amidotransferase A subunit family amidase